MQTQNARFLGLVKFFADETKLQSLVEGCFWCNTPEYYRRSNAEGVSDKNESCAISYRASRNDPLVTLTINGEVISDAISITIHRGDDGDGYMHCWFALYETNSPDEEERLNNTITRMKEEFGGHIAFVPAQFVEPLYKRISSLTELEVSCGRVSYSDDKAQWGSFCKALSYEYQNEFRFSIGRCAPDEVNPLILKHEGGFKDLIFPNPLIVKDPSTGDVRVYPKKNSSASIDKTSG